nr:immunoglobulin heavy chain junction region [Mus musculus]
CARSPYSNYAMDYW